MILYLVINVYADVYFVTQRYSAAEYHLSIPDFPVS